RTATRSAWPSARAPAAATATERAIPRPCVLLRPADDEVAAPARRPLPRPHLTTPSACLPPPRRDRHEHKDPDAEALESDFEWPRGVGPSTEMGAHRSAEPQIPAAR